MLPCKAEVDPLFFRIIEAADRRHPARPVGGGFDLAKLDPMPHVLDLLVRSRYKQKISVPVIAAEIAGLVHRLGIGALQGILQEGFGCLFGVLIVAEGNAGPSEIKLPRLPRFAGDRQDPLSLAVKQKGGGISERTPDRNGAFPREGIPSPHKSRTFRCIRWVRKD